MQYNRTFKELSFENLKVKLKQELSVRIMSQTKYGAILLMLQPLSQVFCVNSLDTVEQELAIECERLWNEFVVHPEAELSDAAKEYKRFLLEHIENVERVEEKISVHGNCENDNP